MFTEIEQIVLSLNYNFNNINLIYIDDTMTTDYITSTLEINEKKENTFLVVYNSSITNCSKLNKFNTINIIYLDNELILGSNIDYSLNLLNLKKFKVEDYSIQEFSNIIKNMILLLSQTLLDNNKLYSIKKNNNDITLWKLNSSFN